MLAIALAFGGEMVKMNLHLHLHLFMKMDLHEGGQIDLKPA